MRFAAIAALVATLGVAGAGEKRASARKGPLAKMPSAEGPHIARIKAMADNTWLHLGQPRPDPKWGQSRGRSWCAKMAFAPDLRGAFIGGEGIHAFVKPDGHYMDDYYFYDINAHAWTCIYPGARAGKDQGLKLNKGKWAFENKDGDPIPVGSLAHNYENMDYDVHTGRMIMMPQGLMCMYAPMKLKQVKALLPELKKGHYAMMPSPWYWNTATGKFEIKKAKIAKPVRAYDRGTHGCVYMAKSRKVMVHSRWSTKAWLYDAKTNQWKATARAPYTATSALCCYDSKRDRFISAKSKAKSLYAYSITDDKWEKLEKELPKGLVPATNAACMTYDSANDVLTFLAYGTRRVMIYDFKKKWGTPPQTLPEKEKKLRGGWQAFYDTKLNATFYYRASDSRDKGSRMLVYKYKRRAQ